MQSEHPVQRNELVPSGIDHWREVGNQRNLVGNLVRKSAFEAPRVVRSHCKEIRHTRLQARNRSSGDVADIDRLRVIVAGIAKMQFVPRQVGGGVGIPGQRHTGSRQSRRAKRGERDEEPPDREPIDQSCLPIHRFGYSHTSPISRKFAKPARDLAAL